MICTFYSYKGGVGRSMALASVADAMAAAGHSVLMIDFDLEAPGLEQYFPLDQAAVRSHKGLFDLVLRYKQAMSAHAEDPRASQDFRRLRDVFIAPVYERLPSGGRLDLMPAGCRGSEEELAQYALELRQFDWQDFYFNWGGEIFFEWLRRTLTGGLYDVVLVDSRTGVTEMGGICAYQLADIVVMLCASNHQNVDGTYSVVRNFFSPRVTMLRQSRPLDVLVVPARVELRDGEMLDVFRHRFSELFEPFTPPALKQAGMTFWDLLIPYEPAHAFEERIPTQPTLRKTRSGIWQAVHHLADAIGLLAAPSDPFHLTSEARPESSATVAEPKYDVTTRFAGYDLYCEFAAPDRKAVEPVVDRLERDGLKVFIPDRSLKSGENWSDALRRALRQSRACALFVGSGSELVWASEWVRSSLETALSLGIRIIPVLLPQAKPPDADRIPSFLAKSAWIRFTGEDDEGAFAELRGAIGPDATPAASAEVDAGAPPYRGLEAFREQDAGIFFGREQLVERMTERLLTSRLMLVAGPSGIGKSSVVRAGLIPALRRRQHGGSDRWHYLVIRPGSEPLRAAAHAIEGLLDATSAPRPPDSADDAGARAWADAVRGLHAAGRSAPIVLVIDQFEEVFTLSHARDTAQVFIEKLREIALDASLNVKLVIVMRSDFIATLSSFADMSVLIEDNLVLVGPMTTAEARLAIEKPAAVAGLAFEPGLVDRILRDVADAPGALPLLQYLLLSLWENLYHGYLTVAAYERMGGAQGALSANAEELFGALEPPDQTLAIQILLRLFTLGEGGTIARRSASLASLASAGASIGDVARVVDFLTASRLVVVNRGEGDDLDVELAHDALVRAWPRLWTQVEENYEFLKARTRIGEESQRWEAAGHADDMLLAAGMRLAEATQLLAVHRNDIDPRTIEFIERSVRRDQREKNRRMQSAIQVAVAMAALAIAAIAFAGYGWMQSIRADRDREIAQTEANVAKLASSSAAFVMSPDGTRIITVNGSGEARIIDASTGFAISVLSIEATAVTTSDFSPDGHSAVGAMDGEIRVFDSDARPVVTFKPHSAPIRKIKFSPDGKWIASVGDAGECRLSSVDGGNIRTLDCGSRAALVGVGFGPDGTMLYAFSVVGIGYAFDVRTGALKARILSSSQGSAGAATTTLADEPNAAAEPALRAPNDKDQLRP